jgi:hypothetical protein
MMNLFIHPILFWLNMTEDFLARLYSLSSIIILLKGCSRCHVSRVRSRSVTRNFYVNRRKSEKKIKHGKISGSDS